MLAVMELVVAPLLQRLPEPVLLTKVTLPPWQKVVGPLGVIKGTAGVVLTATTVGVEVAEVQPLATA